MKEIHTEGGLRRRGRRRMRSTEIAKRIMSMLLVSVMVIGLLPMSIFATDDLGEFLDAAIFCSDVHGSTTAVTDVFSQIQSAGITPSVAGFVGDTNDGNVSNQGAGDVTAQAQAVFADITCLYNYGSHDAEAGAGVADVTGLLYGNANTNFYVFSISQSSMQSASPDTSSFTTALESMDTTKPLFIMSHMPLHSRRNDNAGAATWYNAISAAAKTRDIVFFWGHNHTGETEVDREAYYVAKDGSETMTIYNGSTVTPNFTYMNAGYIGQTAGRGGYATTVKIYENGMVFQDYNSSGAVTDKDYTHNVTVARAFAGTSATEEKEVYVLVDAMTVGKDYLIASGNSGTVTLLGQSGGSATTTTATVVAEGDYTYIETADSGYVWNATAHTNSSCSSYPRLINAETYAMYPNSGALAFGDGLTATTGAIYTRYWTYDGNNKYLAAISTNSSSTTYYLNYSDSAFSTSSAGSAIYIYEKQTISVETVVKPVSLAVTGSTVFEVGDAVRDSVTEIKITYSNGSTVTYSGDMLTTALSNLTATVKDTSGNEIAQPFGTAGNYSLTYTYSVTGTDGKTYTAETEAIPIVVNASISKTATVTSIAVSGEKTEYTIGETVRTSDLTVTATYDDNGTTKTRVLSADDYTVTATDMTTEGTKTVTVSYTYNGNTVTDTYEIRVVEADSNEVTLGGTTTTTKLVYVLTSSISSGNQYLIVNGNSAGSYYALANNSGSVAVTGVTVKTGDVDGDGDTETYIELDDATDELWTTSGSSSTTLKNGNYYLHYNNNSLSLSTSNSTTWTYSGNLLYRSDKTNKRYLRYNNGWTTTDKNNNASSVYFYIPTEITEETDTTVKYTMRAEDVTKVISGAGDTASIQYCLQGNGTDLTTLPSGGSYSFTDLSGNNIIQSIDADGKVTFNGNYGTARVKVAYTWTVGDTSYTVYNNITVTATAPYYSIELHYAKLTTVASGATFDSSATYYIFNSTTNVFEVADISAFADGVTYYTTPVVQGEQINEVIALKGIEAGDRYPVWAIVKRHDSNGETDLGALGDKLSWSVSDPAIATIDTATGVITFTGNKFGTFTVTVAYKGDDGKVVTDTITISATDSLYTVPGDGTNDFPEYPNEGAIRFDKNVTAVGNFSETGLVKVELSMTGVPYTTGSEIDVVVMLDITGSMKDVKNSSYSESDDEYYTRIYSTVEATKAFARAIVINEDGSYNQNRIGIYSFNSKGTYTLHDLSAITDIDALDDEIETFIDDYAGGGTPYDDGLALVQSTLTAAKKDGTGNDRQQFAVFMTDGVPTDYEYITGTTHANYSDADDIAGMLNSSDDYATRLSSGYYYEYYSTQMKADGVTIYTVGLGLNNTNSAWDGEAEECYNVAAALLNDISGPANEKSQPDQPGTSTKSKLGSYFFSVDDADAASQMGTVFKNIAQKIVEAAKDVKVEDKMSGDFTMVFELPYEVDSSSSLASQEFYIEVLEYALTAVYSGETITDYTRGTATTLMKLYLGKEEGSYYAASDSSGTHYASPVFSQTALGTKYYWSTTASNSGVSVTVGSTTYYFVSNGTGEYNMTAGAYASGTPETTAEYVLTEDTAPVSGTVYYIKNADGAYTEQANLAEFANATAYYVKESYTVCNDLIIATPYFVYNAETKILVWTAEKLTSSELALSYFLYLTGASVGDSVPSGTYQTNDYAELTYDNFQGASCEQKMPDPQITYNGAQVSYVFYLVNEKGQPVNRAGRVIPFSEAVYVTDVFTQSVVWDGETTQLSAEIVANKYLPDIYKLYDTGASYTIKAYAETSNSSFTIAANESVYTTYVFNTKAGTKYNTPGTYQATDAKMSDFDFANTTVAFAVVWEPKLKEDTVVVDFGLDIVINVSTNDAIAGGVVGVRTDAPSGVTINSGTYDAGKATAAVITLADGTQIGTVTVENLTSVRFSFNRENGMLFDQPVTFYYESDVNYYDTNNDLKSTSMYSSVTIIPAAIIYFEDDFLDYQSYDVVYKWLDSENNVAADTQDFPAEPQVDDTHTVNGTQYTYTAVATPQGTNAWGDVTDTSLNDETGTGTLGNAGVTQEVDRPGKNDVVTGYDANNLYGFDGAYENCDGLSLGSAHRITVDATTYGVASFTFKGTGFDVISVTGSSTGVLVAEVKNESGETVRTIFVDTYWGYSYDSTNGWGAVSSAAPQMLCQIPVITVEGLDYGKYTVTLTATYHDYFDHTGKGENTLYVDAVRIYDPVGVISGQTNTKVSDAYTEDGEMSPTYQELRDHLIDANSFGVTNGAVFIDGIPEAGVADYKDYGPNNELYLKNGQRVMFKPTDDVTGLHIGLSVVANGSATLTLQGYKDGAVTRTVTLTLNTATDMYYDLTEFCGETILITNTGDGILSITTLKAFVETSGGTTGGTASSVLGTVDKETYDAFMEAISSGGSSSTSNPMPGPAVDPDPVEPEVPAVDTQPDTAPEADKTPDPVIVPEKEPYSNPLDGMLIGWLTGGQGMEYNRNVLIVAIIGASILLMATIVVLLKKLRALQ